MAWGSRLSPRGTRRGATKRQRTTAAEPRPEFGNRPVQVSVWYPAQTAGATPMTYGDYVALLAWELGPEKMGAQERRLAQESFARMSGLPVTAEGQAAFELLFQEKVLAVRDARPAEGRFPVLICAPGQGYPAFDNSVMAEYLASHGFIVVASPSFGPDGRDMPDDALAMDAGARDMEYLLGFAQTLPNADPDRVAAMGFSLGGASSALFALRNARVRALVSLDGVLRDDRYLETLAVFPQFQPERLRGGLLWIACGPTNSLPGFAEGSFAEQARHADLVKAVFPGLLHHDFSSMSSLQRRRAQAAPKDWSLATRSYEAASRLILAFLEKQLEGLERKLDQEPEAICKVTTRAAQNGAADAERLPRGSRFGGVRECLGPLPNRRAGLPQARRLVRAAAGPRGLRRDRCREERARHRAVHADGHDLPGVDRRLVRPRQGQPRAGLPRESRDRLQGRPEQGGEVPGHPCGAEGRDPRPHRRDAGCNRRKNGRALIRGPAELRGACLRSAGREPPTPLRSSRVSAVVSDAGVRRITFGGRRVLLSSPLLMPRRLAVPLPSGTLLVLLAIAVGACDSSAASPQTAVAPAAPQAAARDLCAGLVQDHDAHAMTTLPKPPLLGTVMDLEFGTTIRRITAVPASGGNPVIKPLYTTVAAWNADESYLLLYDVVSGNHRLHNGRTYAFIRNLDISPPDLEQVYWHTSDPDLLFYVDDRTLVRYHVSTDVHEAVRTFSFCSSGASGGSDPMFMSWDSNRIGLGCGTQVFIYDIATNTITGQKPLNQNPAQVAPSGTLAFLSDTGWVTNPALDNVRQLDLVEPWGHASLGQLANGHDTWNGAVYDEGPGGNDDIGALVTWDLTNATSRVIVGPKTGFPYPPTSHISAMAWNQPGWVFVSTLGNTSGAGLLDLEMLVADTNTGTVCRIGRHRSWGKSNTHLDEPYWAEAHMVPSPSGTRAVFASDWGNGTTVDTYVVELPTYGSASTLSIGDVTVTEGSGGTRQTTFTVTLVD